MNRRTLICWLCGLLAAAAVAAALPIRGARAQDPAAENAVADPAAPAEAAPVEAPLPDPVVPAEPAADTAAASDEDFEILTRGPVHEAFAEPVTFDPEPGIVVSQAPPQPIEEISPERRPERAAIWIPGYWAWSEDQEDYLWVSGIWRSPPPDYLEWIPGYWQPTDGGYQWISGYWGSLEAEGVTYLPSPPESLEQGPSSEAPGGDNFWVPGSWLWRDGRYVWRPGFWSAVQPTWIWVPAHYVWTPAGCIFVEGYWDRPLEERGLLFAPIYYRRPVYVAADYYYTPSIVIDTGILTAHLFARPRYCHYYFGDYYDPIYYRSYGIYPWFAFHERHYGYDPLYAFCLWGRHGHDRHWREHLVHRYEWRRDHEDFRPPRTYDEQRHDRDRWSDLADDDDDGDDGRDFDFDRDEFEPGKDLSDRDVRDRFRLRDVSQEEREDFVRRGRAARDFERRRAESETGDRVADDDEPRRVERERSPLAREGDDERARQRSAARLLEQAQARGNEIQTDDEGDRRDRVRRQRAARGERGESYRRDRSAESMESDDSGTLLERRRIERDSEGEGVERRLDRGGTDDDDNARVRRQSRSDTRLRSDNGGETERRAASRRSEGMREEHAESQRHRTEGSHRERSSESRAERSHGRHSEGGGGRSSGGGERGGGGHKRDD